MKIKSIKWNGRVESRYYNGENMGQDFRCSEAEVNEFESNPIKRVKEITEHAAAGDGDKWYYDIHYKDGRVLRVFNPIEVLFIDK